MNIPRRLALLATVGLLAAGCGSSAKQTPSNDQSSAGEAKNTVDCQQLERDAEKASSDSESSQTLVLEATGPVATVDGHEITAEQFNEFARSRMPTQHRKMPKPLADRIKRKMTQKLVEQRLIARTLDDTSIRVEQSALESRYLDFKSRFPDKDSLQAFLDQRGTTKKELRAQLCRDVQMQQYLEKHYKQNVDDEAVADYYENNKSEFQTPAKVKASHILVRLPKDASPETIEKKKKKAKDLADKAREKTVDFSTLAKKHSDGPSASRGGQLGYFSRRRMVGEFSNVAFEMEPGEVSDPVRTKFGFHVIKMHDKKEAQSKSLDEARSQIERRLREQSRRTSMNRFLKEAENETTIEYHLDNIEVNMETPEGGDRKMRPPPGGM